MQPALHFKVLHMRPAKNYIYCVSNNETDECASVAPSPNQESCYERGVWIKRSQMVKINKNNKIDKLLN